MINLRRQTRSFSEKQDKHDRLRRQDRQDDSAFKGAIILPILPPKAIMLILFLAK